MDPSNSASERLSAGHVSMMNDVLVTQLPPDILRGVLRSLLGSSRSTALEFTTIVRTKLLHTPLPTSSPDGLLSPAVNSASKARAILQTAKIYLCAHLCSQAFELLQRFPDAIVSERISLPSVESEREKDEKEIYKFLVEVGGDMVQAGQALKESDDRSEETHQSLKKLISSVQECRTFLESSGSRNPWNRAVLQLVDTERLVFGGPSDVLDFAVQVSLDSSRGDDTSTQTVLGSFQLGNLIVPRLWYGLWQLSSPSWGSASAEDIISGMNDMANQGLVAADMADHYADAELLYGQFRRSKPDLTLYCATKWCQFKRVPLEVQINQEWVMGKVMERYNRVGGKIDLLQVHWQHLDDKRYLEVFDHLLDIRQNHPDILGEVGLCNFNAKTTEEICSYLLKRRGGVGIVSNQVQYSLIDQRPKYAMKEVCGRYGVKLVTYGSFCGGFLSNKWLGKDEPQAYGQDLNTSLRKYYDMIQAWGGWTLFQELLSVLNMIGKKYNVDISNVAAKWVLENPETGVVIVGSRPGVTSHIESIRKTMSFNLSEDDHAAIEEVIRRSRVKEMFEQIGDCGDEYR